MKLIYWVLIIAIGSLSILGFMIVVPILIMGQSWWWFFGTMFVEMGIGMIIALLMLITKIRKKTPTRVKIDIGKAKKRAVYENKYDEDNPDNFIINKSKLFKIGEKGAEKTPILILLGKGSENNDDRVAIINLNDAKEEMSRLINPNESELIEAINKIADHPPDIVKEEIIKGIDFKTGMPTITTKTTRPTAVERKIEEEKKEVEMQGI